MREIGGYIELDTYHLPILHEDAVALNCGRNALAYIIRCRKIKKLKLPYFICSSISDICEREGVEKNYYHIGVHTMKKTLMLGSDYGAIEIIKELHKRGRYVIVADYYDTTPAKEIADESWTISTVDIEVLKEKCLQANVEAVITGASDFNTKNARNLCKELNLPIYCYEDYAWFVATNKYEFKKICKEVGAPVAFDYSVEEYENNKENYVIDFPVVLKPVDMSANRGMSYCNNTTELDQAIEKARLVTKNDQLILERKLEGPEYAVNYIIADGEPRLFFFSAEHHQPGELANLYSVIITTNNHLKQYIEEVNEKVIEVFKRAKVMEGVAWVECMLDKDGHFYLLEMGYRFGGEVVNIPYREISGFNSLTWMIECTEGIKHSPLDLPAEKYDYKGVAVSYLLFANREGKIGKVRGLEEIERIPNVLVDITKRSGSKVAQHLTIGVIRAFGQDVYELCEVLKRINELLVVEDELGNNMVIKFDNFQELINEYEQGQKEWGLG